MSRRTRNNHIGNRHRKFIDDVTGQVGHVNNFKMTHNGKMVKPENFDPVPPNEITPIVPEIIPPLNIRPHGPTRSGVVRDVYNFPSSYLDRLQYYPNGILAGELNPDLVSLQLSDIQSWEEIDVVWNAATSQFTNSNWNININFVDNIYDGVFTFGTPIVAAPSTLPAEE